MNEKVITNIPERKLLEETAKMFFDKNFGVKTKSEIELMMFKLYLEAALELAQGDESKVSDYKIGYELGISPSRVRNLRMKVDLQSEDYDWKVELRKVLVSEQNISKSGDFFQITIRSKNLFYAVEDWIEDNGNTLDITLNPKQLRVPKKEFYKLLTHISVLDESQNKEIIRRIKTKCKIRDYVENIIECGVKALEVGSSATDIIGVFSGEKIVSDAAEKILTNILQLLNKQ